MRKSANRLAIKGYSSGYKATKSFLPFYLMTQLKHMHLPVDVSLDNNMNKLALSSFRQPNSLAQQFLYNPTTIEFDGISLY